jgi:hypothetical protein
MSSVTHLSLYRSFLKDNVPSIKRVGKGHIALLQYIADVAAQNLKIEATDEVFIPSKTMRSLCYDYAPIREACCIMKGYSNHLSGDCDLIIGWSEALNDLVTVILRDSVASLMINRRSALQSQEGLWPTKQTDVIDAISLYVANNALPNFKLHNITLPGADVANYKTKETTHRPIHPLQSIPKATRSIIFKGAIEFDMAACFPNLFRKHILRGEIAEHPLFTEMVDDKNAFMDRIISTNAFTYDLKNERGTSAAKAMRSRLFMPNCKSGIPTLKNIGVQWYDELKDWIISQMQTIDNAHLYFTLHEQIAMEEAMAVIGRETVLIRIHDGFIADLAPHISLVQAVTEMEAVTGMRWEAKVL